MKTVRNLDERFLRYFVLNFLVCKKKNCPPTSRIIFSLITPTFNLAATLGGYANKHKDHMKERVTLEVTRAIVR